MSKISWNVDRSLVLCFVGALLFGWVYQEVAPLASTVDNLEQSQLPKTISMNTPARFESTAVISLDVSNVQLSATDQDERVREGESILDGEVETLRSLAESLAKSSGVEVTVHRMAGSSLVTIQGEAAQPDLASDMCNTIARSYMYLLNTLIGRRLIEEAKPATVPMK